MNILYYVVQCETAESQFDIDFEKTPHFSSPAEAEQHAIKLEKETGLNHWVVTVRETQVQVVFCMKGG